MLPIGWMQVDEFVYHDEYDRIGNGSQGTVFKARHAVTGEPAVVKAFDNAHACSREAWALYLLQQQSKHQHPNVIAYKACSEDCRHLVLELADGGDMLEVVQRGPVQGSALRGLFAQMLAGVRHMHASGIAHMDLKLENLVLVK